MRVPSIRGRRLLRVAAILSFWLLAALLILGVFEGVLRWIGFGYSVDPFLEVSADGEPYALLNERFFDQFFREYRLSDMSTPSSTVVRKAKDSDTFRVFVFGGSAAYGWWFQDQCLATILEAQLTRLYPDKRIEVFNTAYHAMNSHVMRRMAEACAGLKPDLFVIYLGNNEIVGPFGLQSVIGSKGYSQGTMQFIIRWQMALSRMRLYQLVRKPVQETVSQAVSEMRWGLVAPLSDMNDPRLERAYALYEENLRTMCAYGREAGAEVALATVGYNLRDWPPTISQHRAGLSADELEKWQLLYDDGVALQEGEQWAEALATFDAALAIDPEHAELHFRRGRCLLALGQREAAKEAFLDAVDGSYSLASANRRINEIVRRVAATEDSVFLAETAEALCMASPDGIPGAEQFYDHVHLTYGGTYTIATEIARNVAGRNGLDASLLYSLEESRKPLAWGDAEALRQLQRVESHHLESPYGAAWLQSQIAELQARLASGASAEGAWLEAAMAAEKPFWVLRFAWSNELLRQGRAVEARDVLVQLAAERPGVWRILDALVNAELRCGEAGTAVEKARAAVAAYGAFPAAWALLGAALSSPPSPDLAAASEAYRNAFVLSPASRIYRDLYAEGLAGVGDFEGCLATLELPVNDGETTARQQAAVLRQGVERLVMAGRLEAAAAGVDLLLALTPEFEPVRNLIWMSGAPGWRETVLESCRRHGVAVPPEFSSDQS